MVYFMGYYRQYLLGRKFTVRTDHSAITWLRNTPDPVGQNARWLEVITEFDFDVHHRPGTSHANADAASRQPYLTKGDCAACKPQQSRAVRTVQSPPHGAHVDTQCPDWGSEALCSAQRADKHICRLYGAIFTGGPRPEWKDVALWSLPEKVYWQQWDRLAIHDQVLCRRFESADGHEHTWQVILPQLYRDECIRLAHTGMTGGHLGRSRTEAQVQRRAYWCGCRGRKARLA